MGYKIPKLVSGFNPPVFVSFTEVYSLYHYMITGKPTQEYYLDQRHKWIHNVIENMRNNGWEMSTDNLILNLKDQGYLEKAGGEKYIYKIFGDLVCKRDTEL